MGSRWGWIPAFLLAMSWVPGGGVDAGIAGERADSLFQAAMTQVGRVPVKEGIEAFERVLKADPKCAPAHYEIAKLYMSLRTPNDCWRAEQALTQAMQLDPGNLEYQITLGDLLWARGLWENAERQYKKILKAHPTNARAAYMIGYYAFKDFLYYRDREPKYREFVKKDREKAITYLSRSIEIDSMFRDAYYQLGLMYFESNQPRGMVLVSELLLKRYPNDKDALLFCGLGYQTMGEEEKSYKFYTEALERMGPEERAVMESVEVVGTKEEQKRLGEAVALKDDASALERFWRKQDPLFLTAFNERRMEHYGRVAYANLRFSQPLKRIAGWQTDPGKTYIKFGRPIHRVAEVAPVVQLEESSPDPHLLTWLIPAIGSSGALMPQEHWHYEGFKVSFIGDGLDEWSFSWVYKEFPKKPLRPVRLEDYYSGQYAFNLMPPRYVDPYRKQKYSLPHQVVAFRDQDSARVEIAYAIPKSRIALAGPEGFVNLDNGLFLFDENWEEVYKKVERVVELETAGMDSFRRNYLLSQRTVYAGSGKYHVAAEVRDHRKGSIGTFREERSLPSRDSLLALSDLLLASQIESRDPSPGGREDLEIVPNPLRTFSRPEPVSVYFEVYNLRQDGFGRTEYEVSYRVGRPERKEVDPALFAALDAPEARARVEVEAVVREDEPERGVDYRVRYVLPERHQVYREPERVDRSERGTETAVTARYAGDRRDDFAYLQIDVGQMQAGIYKLTVTVKDLKTGQVAEREALFRVVE